MNVVEEVKGNIVPDVRGYGLRDALFRLEKLGLKVKVRGIGRVTQQNMQPGYHFKRGQQIEIILGDPEDIPAAERDTTQQNAEQTKAQPNEPEDSELTPTAADEKKYQQTEQAQQQKMQERKAEKAKQNQAEQEKKKQAAQSKPKKQPAIEPKQSTTSAQKKRDKRADNKKAKPSATSSDKKESKRGTTKSANTSKKHKPAD